MKTNIQFWSYLTQFFLEWEMFSDKICGENQDTHLMLNNLFLSKNLAVYETKWKKCRRTGQATDDNMAHALCMLDIWR